MKKTMYFNSEAEMNEYFKDGIPSNVLAVVQPDESDKAVLFTTSNNTSASGTMEDLGGYNIDEDDRNKIDYSYEGVQDYYTYGATQSYVADYVSTYGGGSDVDLTGYATESYVVSKIEDVVGAAPAALDTLKEIGDSLNNDADFAGTMTAALAGKADKSELNSYVSYSYLENQHYLTVQAQADWNVSDSTANSYILNKPNIKARSNGAVIIGSVQATGRNSFSHGDNTHSNGDYSHAEGQMTWTMGDYSHAEGIYTIANNPAEHSEGRYNKSRKGSDVFGYSGNTIHSVGIGTSVNDRRNAIEIMENGDIYAYGVGNYDGTTYTVANSLAYVINDLQDQIDNIPSGGTQADWNESDSSSDAYIKNKPQDLVNQRMLDAVFSQNSMRSAEQYTYSGQVVDYISYLDFASHSDLDKVAWYNNSEDFVENGLTNIIDYNVDESINGFLDTGTIVARYYIQNINDGGYDAAIGIGMVEYEDEDENIQRVPAVIDTHWEVPESNTKAPAPEPELKQTYKELATKEYVESLIGTALSLSEVIVGEETEPAVAKIILTDDNKINYEMNDDGDGVFSLTKNGAEWGYELWVDMYDEDDNLLGRYGVVGGTLRTGDSAVLELEADGGEATQFDANGPVTVTVDTTAMEVSSANER